MDIRAKEEKTHISSLELFAPEIFFMKLEL